MARIAVLGSGGWGIALAVMANRHGHAVTVWSPFPAEIAEIRRFGEHKALLPGVAVPESVTLTGDITRAAGADLILMAVPSFAIGETAERLQDILPPGALVANAAKGLDEATHRRFSEILGAKLPGQRIAVLSGPSHAEEVGKGIPTTVVTASTDLKTAREVQDILMNPQFRIYVNDDLIGVELGGALKNVIALSAGILDGLGLGDNTKAALMTRGLSEMARLGAAMGAKPATFAGLSGMGDLIVTCESVHSRNRRAGTLIGQGIPPAEAVRRVGTVEGYLTVKVVYQLAYKMGVGMPITEQCYRVCYENAPPRESPKALMGRPKKHESEETGWVFP